MRGATTTKEAARRDSAGMPAGAGDHGPAADEPGAEAVAWRHVWRGEERGLKAKRGGGDDGDGDGGGEAATGRTIMDEAASVPEAACAVACDTCS